MSFQEESRVLLFTPGLSGRWGLPVLYWGKPGIGKSRVIEDTATLLGLQTITLIASIREPADFSGLPIPKNRGHSTFVEYAPPAWASDFDIESDGHGLVFLDEISTCPPAVQAALLRLVLDGALGEYVLPNEVRFIAAANPTADAAGGWDLSPPLANRFGHLDWDVPSSESWVDWLVGSDTEPDKTHINPKLEEERVLRLWPNAFAKAKGAVAGFIQSRPDLLFDMPKTGEARRGRSWPSPRTWELATRAIAGCDVHGSSERTRDSLTAAFVGSGAATEFLVFKKNVDLPNPADVLDGKVAFKHNKKRLDKSMCVLSGCTALVCTGDRKKTDEKTKARVEKLWSIMSDICKEAADIVVPTAKALVKRGYHLSAKDAAKPVLVELHPVLAEAGIKP